MVVRFITSKLIPTAATLGVAVTVYSSSAAAFFPPIPRTDDGVVVVQRPPGPVIENGPTPPPPPPTTWDPPPPPPPVDTHEHCGCPTPHDVPEPATIATAIVGFGLLGAAGARKAMKKKEEKKG